MNIERVARISLADTVPRRAQHRLHPRGDTPIYVFEAQFPLRAAETTVRTASPDASTAAPRRAPGFYLLPAHP